MGESTHSHTATAEGITPPVSPRDRFRLAGPDEGSVHSGGTATPEVCADLLTNSLSQPFVHYADLETPYYWFGIIKNALTKPCTPPSPFVNPRRDAI